MGMFESWEEVYDRCQVDSSGAPLDQEAWVKCAADVLDPTPKREEAAERDAAQEEEETRTTEVEQKAEESFNSDRGLRVREMFEEKARVRESSEEVRQYLRVAGACPADEFQRCMAGSKNDAAQCLVQLHRWVACVCGQMGAQEPLRRLDDCLRLYAAASPDPSEALSTHCAGEFSHALAVWSDASEASARAIAQVPALQWAALRRHPTQRQIALVNSLFIERILPLSKTPQQRQ